MRRRLLKATGQRARVDELVTAMNRAAEAAVPEAKTLLVSTVKSMSVEDARRIVSGGDNSVTQFFATKTRAAARREVPADRDPRDRRRSRLADKYNAVAGKAAGMGLVKPQDANIQQYVTRQGARRSVPDDRRRGEEDPPAIRSAPAARS